MKPSKLFLNNFLILLICIIAPMFHSYNNINPKLGVNLSRTLTYTAPEDMNLIWIYFTDKGENVDDKLLSPENFLTSKSIERRMKRIKDVGIVDYSDLPLNSEYVNEITRSGIKIKNKSKWFNSVSCYANRYQIENISEKTFVKKMDLVRKYVKNEFQQYNPEDNIIFETPSNIQDSINYGPSINQSNIINVPPVHSNGYTGQEVLIASFDAGFDNLQHPCFNLIVSKGLRTFDFVNGDTIVANGLGRMGSGAHGTITLSLVSGYAPGNLISPAFNARYILAKTENTDSETPLEEDNWIAAVEWADSLGVDIVTSSLGYDDFEEPYPDYDWTMMDGNTALITRGADLAVHKGIIVVVSAGNGGFHPQHNTLSAPADGDSVITVGSVNLNKQRSGFSSVGPTYDGRIKPDVMALGNFNYTAQSGAGNNGYTSGSFGTSLSCPMVAGVCALVLSANPELTPIEVRDILRSTADNSGLPPNNTKGWGIVNAQLSVQMALNLKNPSIAEDYQLGQNYPNPFNPSTTFRFTLRKNAIISIIVYDVSGKEITRILNNIFFTSGNKGIEFNFNNIGISSGVYFYSLLANGNHVDSKKMIFIK